MTVASFTAAQILRVVPRVHLSRAVGKLCELEPSPRVLNFALKAYSRFYEVDLSDAEPKPDGYSSFDAFFTRRLRAGARPIDPVDVISPSDGRVVAAGDVVDGGPGAGLGRILVKNRPYEVGELIGSQVDAERYAKGEFVVVYLHPRDYHRVHSPVDGTLVEVRAVPGDLFPVNAIGERHVPKLFTRNRRVALVIDTPTLGRVTLIMVGATIVGRISVTALPDLGEGPAVRHVSPGVPVARGDELGAFHLGSTVVVLFEGAGRLSRATGPVQLGQGLVKN